MIGFGEGPSPSSVAAVNGVGIPIPGTCALWGCVCPHCCKGTFSTVPPRVLLEMAVIAGQRCDASLRPQRWALPLEPDIARSIPVTSLLSIAGTPRTVNPPPSFRHYRQSRIIIIIRIQKHQEMKQNQLFFFFPFFYFSCFVFLGSQGEAGNSGSDTIATAGPL